MTGEPSQANCLIPSAVGGRQESQARFFSYDKVFSMYGLGLVVNEKTIAERPKAVAAAVRGALGAGATR